MNLQDIINKHANDINNIDTEGNYEGFTYLQRLYSKLEGAEGDTLSVRFSALNDATRATREQLDGIAETIEEVKNFISDLSQLDVNQCDTEN